MKIKIFNCVGDAEDVEKEVNSFIKDKKVIDMKFNADSKRGFVDWGWLFVMYEEPEDLAEETHVQQLKATSKKLEFVSGDPLRIEALQVENSDLVNKVFWLRDLLNMLQFRVNEALEQNLSRDQLIDVLKDLKDFNLE